MEACELIHRSGLKHDRQVVSHNIGVAAIGLHDGGVAREPLLRVGVIVVLLNIRDLEVRGHYTACNFAVNACGPSISLAIAASPMASGTAAPAAGWAALPIVGRTAFLMG